MAVKIPTMEELKKLSPEERIKRLKLVEEARRKELEAELENAKRQAEEEIRATEEMIKETEGEQEEEDKEEQEREAMKKEVQRKEEESLEERLAQERQRQPDQPQEARQYHTNVGNPYDGLDRAINELDRLYRNPDFSPQGTRAYEESKAQIERAQQYGVNSPKFEQELGAAQSVLNRLKYRH